MRVCEKCKYFKGKGLAGIEGYCYYGKKWWQHLLPINVPTVYYLGGCPAYYHKYKELEDRGYWDKYQ